MFYRNSVGSVPLWCKLLRYSAQSPGPGGQNTGWSRVKKGTTRRV